MKQPPAIQQTLAKFAAAHCALQVQQAKAESAVSVLNRYYMRKERTAVQQADTSPHASSSACSS
jgi:hypothetical protein